MPDSGQEEAPPTETDDSEPVPPPESETCRPVGCEERGLECGTVPDGCGGTLNCGGCSEGKVCGLRQPNVCGIPVCTPRTCAEVGAQCGAVRDGCGGQLQCGTCGVGQTCGGGGRSNVCGAPNYGVETACSRDGVCFLNPRPVSHDLKDVWGRSVEDFWAVGNAGFIVHGGPGGLTVLPRQAELSGIWGSAAEEVWAVGSQILYFDGRYWSTVLQPAHFLYDVHGTGASNVWAVGERGIAYAWDGARWKRESTGTSADLYGVWTQGDTVWAVGAGATIRVRDAKGWRVFEAPATDVTFTAVWGSGPEDVWVTGSKSDAVLFHWDGREWSSVSLPFSALYGISGKSSADILVVGEEGAWRYDGSIWSPVLGSARLLGAWHTADGTVVAGAAGRVLRTDSRLGWLTLERGVRTDIVSLSAPEDEVRWWFADGSRLHLGMDEPRYIEEGPGNVLTEQGPGRLWVAGNSGRVDLYTWNNHGGGTNSFYLPESFSLRGVSPINGLLAWLVGTDTQTGEGVLVQLDGHTSWTRYPLAAPGAINAIHGSAPDNVWAVGDSLLLHWDGMSWNELRTPWLPSFRAVKTLGRDLAWALGPHSLWRWDGTHWAPIGMPANLKNPDLRALFADSRDELYIAGEEGLLLHYDVQSGIWQRIETGTRKGLRALSGGPRTLIVGGEDGTVLRLYRQLSGSRPSESP